MPYRVMQKAGTADSACWQTLRTGCSRYRGLIHGLWAVHVATAHGLLPGRSTASRKLRDFSIPCQAVVGSLAGVRRGRAGEVVNRGFFLTFCFDRRDSWICFVRPGVHAPIKSVSVPAPISVVLVFHVTL